MSKFRGLAGLCLLFETIHPSFANASDLRLFSMGDLSVGIEDEVSLLQPFTFGSAAGMLLLAPVSRFDAAFGVDYLEARENAPGGGFFGVTRKIGTGQNPLGDGFLNFEGFLWRPSSRLAFQFSGDWDTFYDLLQEEADNPTKSDTFRGLFRAAVKQGPLLLGLEGQTFSQDGEILEMSDFPFPVTSVTLETKHQLVGGDLFWSFPAHPEVGQGFFLVGGEYRQGLPNASLIFRTETSLAPAGFLEQRFLETKERQYGPHFYWKTASGLEGAAFYRTFQSAFDIEESSGGLIADPPRYPGETFDFSYGLLALRGKKVINADDTLLLGGAGIFGTNKNERRNSIGERIIRAQSRATYVFLGAGYARKKTFTLGVQFSYFGRDGEREENTAMSPSPISFSQDAQILTYQLGGERMLSTKTAWRMGVILERALNQGQSGLESNYITYPPSASFWTSILTTGIGVESQKARWEVLLYSGQIVLTEGRPADTFGLLGGARTGFTFFF